MARVRRKPTKNQRAATPASTAAQPAMPLDDGTLTTPVSLAMIQALIPLGLKAVEERLQAEVLALAGVRYAHADGQAGVVRWGKQAGSIYLADQKVPITVPRVRDRVAGLEVPLATSQQLQTPRAQDLGLFRRVFRRAVVPRVRGGRRGGPGSLRAGPRDGVAPVHSGECAGAPASPGTLVR